MDSTDLEGLVKYFNDKVERFDQLVPLARLCKHGINQMLGDAELDQPIDLDHLPDLTELTNLVSETKSSLEMLDQSLTKREREMKQQHEKLLSLISDVTNHLEHLSSNFPVDFGKPPAGPPPKPKYGIHVQKKSPS